MTDRSTQIAILSELYEEYQDAKTSPKVREIRREYKRQAEEAVKQYVDEKAKRFAAELHDAVKGGLPGGLVREHVLHTQDWNRWRKWRDLAGLDPERVSIRNAKEEAIKAKREAAPYTLRYDNGALTGLMDVFRNHRGETILPLAFKFSVSPAGNLTFDLENLSRDLDDLVDRFGPGTGDSIQNARTFLVEAVREAGDYDEMLAWAKAVKK